MMATAADQTKIGELKPGLRVFISGGAAGIGRTIADLLIEHGARVHVCDVSEENLNEFSATHPGHGATKADVADEIALAGIFKEIESKWGGLDALINNAGIAGPTGGVEEIEPAEWRRCIDIDLTGQFLCAHFAVPMLKQAGGGSIVNMSSAAGRFGYAFRTPYSAAKWGIIGLTQSLAKELGPSNIRVNAILPGIIEGDRMENVIAARAEQLGLSHGDMKKQYLEKVSLRRMTPQKDIATMALFLLSVMGENLSGQSFGVDGNVEAL